MKHTPEEKQRYVDQFRASIEEGERLVKGKGQLMTPHPDGHQGINGHLVLLESGIRIKRSDPMVFLTQGVKGDKEIPFPQIASIQLKKAGLLPMAISGYPSSRDVKRRWERVILAGMRMR